MLALTAAVLFSVASALSQSPLYSCLLSAKGAQQGFVCPDSVGPFHLLCNQVHANEAADACIAEGWRLAVLDDSNKRDALWQMRNCTPGNAWIDSFNGVQGAGCFQFRGDIPMVETDLTARYCDEAVQAVLCEDVPVEVLTTTSYTATTVTTGVRTKTKEVVPTCPHRPHKPCHGKMRDSEFVVIRDRVPFVQAECACKQLNMRLADLTILNFLDASHELFHELGPAKNAWVHSWNGDRYSHDTCLALWTGAAGPGGAIAQPRHCSEHLAVVCQRPSRPKCPCRPAEHDCHCNHPAGRPAHRKPEESRDHHIHKRPSNQRVFLELEAPKPLFSNPAAKAAYLRNIDLAKKQQTANELLKKPIIQLGSVSSGSGKPQAVGHQHGQSAQPAQPARQVQFKEPELKRPQDIEEDLLDDPEQDKCIAGRGRCHKVCKYRAKNIRVVYANASAYDASQVCAKFGWSLLDYDNRMDESVAWLKDKCWNSNEGMWIRSYDGVDGGACMLVGGEGRGVPVGWVLGADDCLSLGGKNVLCQTNDRPVETSTGTYVGSLTYTTTTTNGLYTSTSYTRTVTRTVTLLQ